MNEKTTFWNPYVAGIVLGLVLLMSFVVTGKGLGASGAFKSLEAVILHAVNPTWVEEHHELGGLFSGGQNPLTSWIVFVALGTFLGGVIGTVTAQRFHLETLRGPRVNRATRLVLAFLGGNVSAVAAQIARGCTSGQALTGGAQLALGSWIFMIAVFAGAYGMAYFVRKQWI